MRDVIPSREKRASVAASLNMGVGERGSQNRSVPSESAVTIRLPRVVFGKMSLAYSQYWGMRDWGTYRLE